MNSKIRNMSRYKKVSKADIKKRNKEIKRSINRYNFDDDNNFDFSYTLSKKNTVNKVNIKKENKFNLKKKEINYRLILGCVLCLFFIAICSMFLIEKKDKVITVFGNNNEKINININYDLKIGIKDLDINKNVCINELNKYTKGKLLIINDKYEIVYKLAESVEKVTDTAYIIKLKDDKYTNLFVEKLKEESMMKFVEKIDSNNISVILYKENPYFIYYLSRINIDINETEYNYLDLKYTRNDKINNRILENISIKNYDDTDLITSDFIDNKIDMFLTSSEDDLRAISSANYNLKKYKNGENYFMFFNGNNKILKNKDIRKSILLGINKNKIVKDLNSDFYEIIDVPYLYGEITSKYDKIGSENIIIKNSYIKKNGIYYNKNIPLIFKLIVNKNDKIKCKIADDIKIMLEEVGIRINVAKYNDNEMKNNIKNKNYDLVIATVNLNEIPDISFLYDYLNIDNILDNHVNSNNIVDYVNDIKNKITDNVLCVGIASRTTSVVTNKNIYGFNNISYNNIFKDIHNIGSKMDK